MPLTGDQKRQLIARRAEDRKALKAELRAGTYDPPPPLLLQMTHISEIAPPVRSQAQRNRDKRDQITRLERILKTDLPRAERERISKKLAELK